MPPNDRTVLPQGTLDLLVLRTLSLAPMHGYAIAKHIERTSGEVFRVEQGSLYPALERIGNKGWVTSKWKLSPTGRRARYYTITASGRAKLGDHVSDYWRVTSAIGRVLAEE